MHLVDVISRKLSGDSPGLVIAVSGGADSVALLRAVLQANIAGPIIAAHLNHGLRGSESDTDEQFVRSLTEHVGVPLFVGHATPLAGNIEGAARRQRYRFLARIAREQRVTHIATAHTLNDQAETILHRLLRGSGLRGLRGIAPVRRLNATAVVVRPLLDVTRRQVLEYLSELGQSFREDSSNADRRFTRNRIRLELLPQLEAQYNPAIARLMARLARQADELYRDVHRRARRLLRRCERPAAGELRILDVPTLSRAPRTLQREAFRLLWRRERWSCDRMRFAEWDRLADVATGLVPAVDLPGRIHARRRGTVLQIGRSRNA